MSEALLHLVVARLREDLEDEARTCLADLARGLDQAEGVDATLVACSATTLISATWLSSPDRLEGFASSPPHLRFVLEGVARYTAGMWSASLTVPPRDAALDGDVGALWAFGLPADPPAFEWQVRELLAAVAALPGEAAAGPTVEERERLRAGGVVRVPSAACGEFEARLASAREGWGSLADYLEAAYAPVIAA